MIETAVASGAELAVAAISRRATLKITAVRSHVLSYPLDEELSSVERTSPDAHR